MGNGERQGCEEEKKKSRSTPHQKLPAGGGKGGEKKDRISIKIKETKKNEKRRGRPISRGKERPGKSFSSFGRFGKREGVHEPHSLDPRKEKKYSGYFYQRGEDPEGYKEKRGPRKKNLEGGEATRLVGASFRWDARLHSTELDQKKKKPIAIDRGGNEIK